METNGVKYENGLPLPSNSWLQTAVYLLSSMQITQQELLEKLSTGNTGTLTIVNSTYLKPQQHIELYNPFPHIVRLPQIEIKNITYDKPPIIVHKPVLEIYERCCGKYESRRQKKFDNCKKRVDHCYKLVMETKGVVTMNDMTMTRIKLPDCGCSSPLNEPINLRGVRLVDIFK